MPLLPDSPALARGLLIYLPGGGIIRLFRAGLDRCGWAGVRLGDVLVALIQVRLVGITDIPNHNPTLALRLSPGDAAILASPLAMLAGAELKPVVLQPEAWGHA